MSTAKKRLFFDEHQWKTVAAAMARIIPTDDQPGATEANCIRFVDQYLSGIEYVYAKPDGSGFVELTGKDAEAYTKRIAMLRETYAEGIQTIDRLSQESYSKNFYGLSSEEQDKVLVQLENLGRNDIDGKPAPQQVLPEEELAFFPLLILQTRQGFYADPIYGGNKGQVGWKVIGFPGPKSLADAQSGKYTTLPYFASTTENGNGR